MIQPSVHAPHEVAVRVEEREYDVFGADERMLELAMDLRGPRRAGRAFVAFTDWEVHWARTGDGPRVRFHAVVTLPRWRPPPFVGAELVERWARFHDALVVHERGHVDIGLAAARALAAELGDAPRNARDWASVTRAVVAPYLDAERRYDAQTKHGAAQGAVLRSIR
jgi:predicted secreted Zn-dependent protease